MLVDLVSPSRPTERTSLGAGPFRGSLSRGSFGSSISETPSPAADEKAGAKDGVHSGVAGALEAGATDGGQNGGAGTVDGAGTANPARALHQCMICPISGLKVNDKLAHKLQNSAQVTTSTLRTVLHNSLGYSIHVMMDWSKDTLIHQYTAALLRNETPASTTQQPVRLPASPAQSPQGKHGTACSDADSIECIDMAVDSSSLSRLSPSRDSKMYSGATHDDVSSDVDDLTAGRGMSSKSWVRKMRHENGKDVLETAEEGGVVTAAPSCGVGRGKADAGVLVVEEFSLWRRLEHKRQRDRENKTTEESDCALPLWQRLESRRKRELSGGLHIDEQLGVSEAEEDDNIFGVAKCGGASSGSSSHAVAAGIFCEVGDVGTPSKSGHIVSSKDEDDVTDLTCASNACAVGTTERNIEGKVARLERERDESVRRQTEDAVAALDFERAALVKHTIHAAFQKKISILYTAGRVGRKFQAGDSTSTNSASASVHKETGVDHSATAAAAGNREGCSGGTHGGKGRGGREKEMMAIL